MNSLPDLQYLLLLLLLCACNTESETFTGTGNGANGGTGMGPDDWLVPISEVLDGGPGRDGIPSIDEPVFEPVSEANFVDDDELVIGVKNNEVVRAYPHSILDWHEIVNDQVGHLALALTYCPLTGTGVGWNREVDGTLTTFGVSGLLYQTNLMPYDRATGSTWSQMRLDCVNGQLIETRATVEWIVETKWSTWRQMFPGSEVLSRQTGISRDYNSYPYGDYRTSDQLFFPVSNEDPRLPRKDRVLGVIVNGRAKAFPVRGFSGNETRVITDRVGGERILVYGNESDNYLVAYANAIQGTDPGLTFQPAVNSGPQTVLTDNEGNQWNIFGEAVDGPREGQQLDRVTAFIGYWFAWAAFYPEIELR